MATADGYNMIPTNLDPRVMWAMAWGTGVLLVTFLGFLIVRRRLRARAAKNEERDKGPPFTLAELREMAKGGLISPEEFDNLKKLIIGRVTKPDDKSKGR